MSTCEVDRLMPFAGGRRPKPRHRPGATAKRERQLRAKDRLEEKMKTSDLVNGLRMMKELENLNRNLSPVQHNTSVISLGPLDEVHS